jgi:HAD superfamily hydrolase (TIGR01509 family)
MIDSKPIALEVWRTLGAEYDREVSEEHYRQIIGESPKFGVRLIQSALEFPLAEDGLLDEYWSRRTEVTCHKTNPEPGLVDLLDMLKENSIQNAVASNSPRHYLEKVLEALDLTGYFRCVRSSEDVARGKPAPDVYEATLKCLEIAASEGLVLEDSLSGVKAAKAAGLTCFAIPSEELRDADFSEADEVFESLEMVVRAFRSYIEA